MIEPSLERKHSEKWTIQADDLGLHSTQYLHPAQNKK
jgi:hypothetical protein